MILIFQMKNYQKWSFESFIFICFFFVSLCTTKKVMQLFELQSCRELLTSYLCSFSAGTTPNNTTIWKVVKGFFSDIFSRFR